MRTSYMPKMKIVNGMSKTAKIKEQPSAGRTIISSVNMITAIIGIIGVILSGLYLKLIFQENEFLQKKITQGAILSEENQEDNMVLKKVSDIISREGKVSTDLAKNYTNWIFESASNYKINPMLLMGLISVESNFDFQAVSSGNAVGLTQVIFSWHKEKVRTKADLFDPRINIQTGARILREYLDRSGTEIEALLRYNGSVGKSPDYAIKVLTMKKRFEIELIKELSLKKF